ncbi:hypothetical protein G6F56_005890 [Rhizopus delemar]|nr:hypothetical protein G6F56_005890 [Rhizopus delemar]
MPITLNRTYSLDFSSMATVGRKGSISVLSGESDGLKTIQTFMYNDELKTLTENKKSTIKVEETTHTLLTVPQPLGGMLVIGEYIITYYDPYNNNMRELSIDPVKVTSWTFMRDGSNRCLLGDEEGYLYLFSVETANNRVVNLSSTIIGQVSRANCIVDLDNMMFYIGSAQGDSCLIQLVKSPESLKYSVKVLATYSCLGPIGDFCLFDYNKQGKQTMACCSGTEKDASIRIVENGIGFNKNFTLEFPLVSAVWSLGLSIPGKDSLLVSTAFNTVLLKPSNKLLELEEQDFYSALNLSQITLAADMYDGAIVQITSLSARMMTNDKQGKLIHEWKPPGGLEVSIAKIKGSLCVLCCQDDTIVYLEMTNKAFIQKNTTQVSDTSCLTISLKEENDTEYDYVAVGTCGSSPSVQFLRLPDLECMLDHRDMSSTTGPIDLLSIMMEDTLYFMILLGDGQMYSYSIEIQPDEIMLESETEIMVGTYCTALYPYQHDQQEKRIFVAGQRPTVIVSVNQSLLVYSVNLTNIFGLTKYNDMLGLMTESQLLFGQNDKVSKLHHTKYELPGEMPLRIEYTSNMKALVVGSCTNVHDINRNVVERTGKIRILNAQTFQVLDTYNLGVNEIVECITIVQFSEYPDEYVFVGTLIEDHEDPDKDSGRILVFTTESSKCELVDIVSLPNAVYSIVSIGNTVIASVQGQMYGLCRFQPDLLAGERIEFKFLIHDNVAILDMDTDKNNLLVGDLTQSMSLWKVNNDDKSLELKLEATDNEQVWITAVKFVSESVIIGADDRKNIFTMSKPSERSSRGISKLEIKGGYHIGSLINRFRKGILRDVGSIPECPNTISKYQSAFTFATANGSIGTVKTINAESFEFFQDIQKSILEVIPNRGNLDHSIWRSFAPKFPTTRAETNYLDGDILKLYSSLRLPEKQKIVEPHPNITTKDLEKWIFHLVS